jgi:hypothetical protein
MNRIKQYSREDLNRVSTVNAVSPDGEPFLFSMEVIHGE